MKNSFVLGILLALSVVITDALQSFVTSHSFDVKALLVATGIALIGYLGKFLTGNANTNVALIGSAMLTIVPLITTGKIDWPLVAATFAIKLIGLFSSELSQPKT